MHSTRQTRANLRTFLLTAMSLAIALVALWPGLHGWFVFDDHVNLVATEHWKVTTLDWKDWRRALASDISGAVARPLAMASFAANYYLTGLDPFWLKTGNLALHLLNSLLAWRLLHHVFRQLPESQSIGMHAAWLVALTWAVHPLHVSTVMYIVQRMEIGAATGVLLTLLAYVIGRARQIEGLAGWPWLAMTPLTTALGLGFKETALLAPGFALLIELTILRFRCHHTVTSRRWKTVWAGLALGGLALYLYVIIPTVQDWPYGLRDFGPTERLLTQIPVLVMYIQQILLPLPESMRFYYDNYPVSRDLTHPTWTAASAVILLTMPAIAIAALRRFPLVALGIGWFFMGHALTSNLWPLELAFEHRNYLPSLGLLVALVQPIDILLRRLNADAKTTILTLPLLLLVTLCNLQSRTWADPMRLAWTLESRNPESPRASYDLGTQFLAAAHGDQESIFWSMARKQFERGAIGAKPSALSLQGLLLMHGRARAPLPSRYWDMLRASLTSKEFQGELPGVLHALTACQIQDQCEFDHGQMLDTFIAVIQRNPHSPVAHTLYANFAWSVLGDHALATELQREAARLEPEDPVYRVALAKFLLASMEEASFTEARELLQQLRKQNRSGQLDKELAELEALMLAAKPANALGP